ncbi:hypothetical protein B4135_0383 [Caldibacillus debilis]|uniref:Uncharacterized protein n=1 Tax=Caldibacillus debilis TaxID=301148 RepID=A0A150LKK2_9BACI|nr:hypothetical protein B4135_0383 [Caldibacillus debilis]
MMGNTAGVCLRSRLYSTSGRAVIGLHRGLFSGMLRRPDHPIVQKKELSDSQCPQPVRLSAE